MSLRPFLARTLLFTPADRPSAMTKALMLAADVVVLDMEDAVAVQEKEATRVQLASFLSSITPPPARTAQTYPKIMVRINCPVTTPFGLQDLASLAPLEGRFDALLLPKVESLQTVQNASELLFYGSPRATEQVPFIWAMIESCRGLHEVEAIARSPLVAGLVFGSNDMTKDLRAQPSADRLPLLYAMSRTVAAARAAGKVVVDGVYMDLSDDGAGLRKDAALGRSLGFEGKTLIHPRQVAAANEVYSPSSAELAAARGVVLAFAEAQAGGRGVCVYAGRLVEALHVEQARELLEMHESILRRAAQ